MPPPLRQQLVNELMAARRAVATAASEPALGRARRRVMDAKVALGERGQPWWLDASPAELAPRIEAAILALLRSRSPGATICPSEAARIAGGPSWRRLLPQVRTQAALLAHAGRIDVMRGRARVVHDLTRGVLRYRLMDLD